MMICVLLSCVILSVIKHYQLISDILWIASLPVAGKMFSPGEMQNGQKIRQIRMQGTVLLTE